MWVGTLDLVNLVAVTEHHECGNARDSVGGSDFLLLLGVDLGEGDDARLGDLSGELLVERGDGFAWSAPIGIDCDTMSASA